MKNVVITGASGVLCRELSKALAKEGYGLALIARNKEKLIALQDEIRAGGGTAFCYTADVTDCAAMEAVHKAVLQDLGPCDILINGAGGNHPDCTTTSEVFSGEEDQDFFHLSKDGFSHVFNINLWGSVLPSQIFGKDMIGRSGCTIVNISSMAAFSPLTKTPAYCAAKAGISNFTQWLAVHFAASGIRVNAIAPGFFLTQQNHHLLFDENENPTPRAGKILSNTPMKRFGEPQELVGALLFLLDETRSGFITGCILPVDGGFSAYSGV